MNDELRTVLAVVLLAMPVFPLAMFVVLVEHTWSDNLALRERTGIAIRDLVASSIVALVSANYLFQWNLNDALLFVAFAFAMIAISVPSLVWLVIYFRNGFR